VQNLVERNIPVECRFSREAEDPFADVVPLDLVSTTGNREAPGIEKLTGPLLLLSRTRVPCDAGGARQCEREFGPSLGDDVVTELEQAPIAVGELSIGDGGRHARQSADGLQDHR
jgi:hypothetical protein